MPLRQSSGQALLVVVVTMAVIVTIALSVASRSVTDISVTTKEEEALRSFSAAEAGIEQTLLNPAITTGTFGNATFTTTTSNVAQGAKTFNYPKDIMSGENATFWFISHNDSGALVCDGARSCFTGSSVKLCWGKSGTSAVAATAPALEFSVFYDPNADGNFADLAVVRGTFDPNASRTTTNYFTGASGSCSIDSKGYAFSGTVDLGALGIPPSAYNRARGLIFIKTRMLYNSDTEHPIGLDVTSGPGMLPSQGTQVESTGQSGASNRKVQVFTLFPEPPAIFDSVLYTPQDIIQ